MENEQSQGRMVQKLFFLFLIRGLLGFPGGTSGKESTCYLGNIRDASLIPGLGGSPGWRQENPLQYPCLKNPMDRGAWQVTVHRVAKSQTGLKWLSTHVRCVGFCHATMGNDHNLRYISHNYIPSLLSLPAHSHPTLCIITEHQARFYVWYSSFLIAIYFTYYSVYISMLLSQFFLPSPFPTVSTSLSTSLLLPCK